MTRTTAITLGLALAGGRAQASAFVHQLATD